MAEGSEPGGVAPEVFAEHIRREIARWVEVLKVSGCRLSELPPAAQHRVSQRKAGIEKICLYVSAY
jgi:hypothetical protein